MNEAETLLNLIDEAEERLKFLREEFDKESGQCVSAIEQAKNRLIDIANETSAPVIGLHHSVIWTKGREVNKLNAEAMYPHLTEDIKRVGYKITYTGITPVLQKLYEAGSIPEETWSRFYESKPADPRWIFK